MPEYLAPGVYVEEIPVKHANASFEDIPLPESELARLKNFCIQVQGIQQSAGSQLKMTGHLLALFAGPSGSGKTLAAEVLSGSTGLPLYRIDLASVMSKYIGETEKNLDRVFEQARNTGSILFFDEADALFGRRTSVSDAHDRYANIEVNYLLQNIEAFNGVIILASNATANIDRAFKEHLRTIIEFPAPEPPPLNLWMRLWRWIRDRLFRKRTD